MTPADLGAFAKAFAADTKTAVAAFLEKTLADQTSRIAALEKRIEQLEQRKVSDGGLKWSGVFQVGIRYTEGSLCTHAGSLWLATGATNAIPGDAASAWKLIVKNGSYNRENRR